IFRVRLTGNEADVRAFLVKRPSEVRVLRRDAGVMLIDLDLPEPLLKMPQAFKLTLALDHDSVDQGELRQKEVGKGNRFESGEVPPGFGRKIPQGAGGAM